MKPRCEAWFNGGNFAGDNAGRLIGMHRLDLVAQVVKKPGARLDSKRHLLCRFDCPAPSVDTYDAGPDTCAGCKAGLNTGAGDRHRTGAVRKGDQDIHESHNMGASGLGSGALKDKLKLDVCSGVRRWNRTGERLEASVTI